MKIKAGKWYWTRSGRLVFILNLSDFDPTYCTLGLLDGLSYVSFTGSGFFWCGMIHDFDLVAEPASRERIIFPEPANCPRWFDNLKVQQKLSEEVLFD